MRLRFSPPERLGARSWVWQLMFFIVACVTVLFAFQAFRQPPATTSTESSDDGLTSAAPFTLPARNELADDEFSVPPPDLDTGTTTRVRPVKEPAPQPGRRLNVDISAVRDNTLGIRVDESAAFFDLMQEARRLPPENLDLLVRHDVQYANLMADPATYRGQVVGLSGELWQLTPFRASRNRHGLETLYEAWIVTPDSAPHAYRVVTSQVGQEFASGAKSRVPVFVTGYFFKREGYAAPHGVEVAPTILGAHLAWDETMSHPAGMAAFPPWMIGLMIAGGLILTATMLSLALAERRSVRQQPRYESLRVETLTALAALPPYSVANVLLELEERDRARQFETIRPPHALKTASLWSRGEHERGTSSDRAVDMPTPTPPTRQFRRGWKQRWTGETPPSDTNGQ